MTSPDGIAAWLARALRVRTGLQFFALALVLLFALVMRALRVPGWVAACVAIGALVWFAVVTLLAFAHARASRSPADPPGGDDGLV